MKTYYVDEFHVFVSNVTYGTRARRVHEAEHKGNFRTLEEASFAGKEYILESDMVECEMQIVEMREQKVVYFKKFKKMNFPYTSEDIVLDRGPFIVK